MFFLLAEAWKNLDLSGVYISISRLYQRRTRYTSSSTEGDRFTLYGRTIDRSPSLQGKFCPFNLYVETWSLVLHTFRSPELHASKDRLHHFISSSCGFLWRASGLQKRLLFFRLHLIYILTWSFFASSTLRLVADAANQMAVSDIRTWCVRRKWSVYSLKKLLINPSL